MGLLVVASTGRNLDWQKGSGIAKYKLITIHHPPGGERTGEGGGPIAHATIGFSGLWGALAGISAAGRRAVALQPL